MTEIARDALAHNNITINDLALVVPHQANIRIIQALATNLHLPMEKVYTNIHRYGNTSSATIPIALDEANREGRLIKDTLMLLVSFGAGLTWGASILSWSI
jgi:3-oxoacyl-[acyl-carrier-protein] synthase-3